MGSSLRNFYKIISTILHFVTGISDKDISCIYFFKKMLIYVLLQ